MNKDKKNMLSEEDRELWNLITKNDKKYKTSNYLRNKSINTKEIKEDKKKRKNLSLKDKINIVEKKIIEKEEKREPILQKRKKLMEILNPEKIPSGISLRQAENLRRGKLKPEKTIDLHGFTSIQARDYVAKKLIDYYNRSTRCVLIITGKKFGPKGSEGVLRKEVHNWLNASPLREVILMTSWASSQHGGQGALYVLLKNVKKHN